MQQRKQLSSALVAVGVLALGIGSVGCASQTHAIANNPEALSPSLPAPPTQTATLTPGGPTTQQPEKPLSVVVDRDEEPKPGTPLAVIEDYEREVKSVLKRYDGKSDQASEAKKREELHAKVKRFFDFRELAQLSMSTHWGGLSRPQRRDFENVFTSLIENTYLERSNELVSDYNVQFGDEKISGKKASVVSTIARNDVDLHVVYEMKRQGTSWVIYNIIFDELNLLANYRSQFNRIIKQKSFAELMKLMRKRLKSTQHL